MSALAAFFPAPTFNVVRSDTFRPLLARLIKSDVKVGTSTYAGCTLTYDNTRDWKYWIRRDKDTWTLVSQRYEKDGDSFKAAGPCIEVDITLDN